jgi:predicted  nucleic acid-binding Zn-ribbon protein
MPEHEEDVCRERLRDLENEIADLRARQGHIAARLTLLEARRREILDRATRVPPLRGSRLASPDGYPY